MIKIQQIEKIVGRIKFIKIKYKHKFKLKQKIMLMFLTKLNVETQRSNIFLREMNYTF